MLVNAAAYVPYQTLRFLMALFAFHAELAMACMTLMAAVPCGGPERGALPIVAYVRLPGRAGALSVLVLYGEDGSIKSTRGVFTFDVNGTVRHADAEVPEHVDKFLRDSMELADVAGRAWGAHWLPTMMEEAV